VCCDDLIQSGRCYPERPKQGAPETAANGAPERRWFGPPERAVLQTVETLKAAVCPSDRLERPERIYISRRGTDSFRKLLNEAEIEVVAERLGFKIVRTEDYSFDDQVAMFSGARVVLGPHGAGMTNAAFAPPGCLVCDFFSDGWKNDWSLRLTQLFGHRYLALCYPDAIPTRAARMRLRARRVNFAYRVAPDDLTRVITGAMRSLGL
jgi:capsular polysaccharide biosynthesis protein